MCMWKIIIWRTIYKGKNPLIILPYTNTTINTLLYVLPDIFLCTHMYILHINYHIVLWSVPRI